MRKMIVGFSAASFLIVTLVYVSGLSLPARDVVDVPMLTKGICKEDALGTIVSSSEHIGNLVFVDTEMFSRLDEDQPFMLREREIKARESNYWHFALKREDEYFDGFQVRHAYTLYFDDDCISSIWHKRFFLQK